MRLRFDLIEQLASSQFHRLGIYISKHPYPFIAFPLLLTLACSVGFLHLNLVTDAIYLFTPVGAQSKIERQAIHEKWPLTDGNYVPGRAVTQSREVQVTVLARDDENILTKPYSEAVYRLNQFILSKVRVLHDGRFYTYKELCMTFKSDGCQTNRHVHIISDLFEHGFNITFPYFRLGTEGGYLGSSMGGVSLMKLDNGTQILAGARAWFMIYQLQFYPKEISYISGLWENALGEALKNYPPDPYITITYFHSQTLTDELGRNADSLMPRFVVAFSTLVVFSCVCSISLIDGTFYIDWVLSKPILSVIGVMSAGMSIVTSIGGLSLIGMAYNDIVAVMPFLVVAVGTDNMFLMVSAVRRTSRSHPAEKRMAECMADAAVSILITSSTDVLSFGVGTITSIPAVQIFCTYTGVAIFFAFVYQITFFAGCLALFTRYEEEERNSVFYLKTIPEGSIIKAETKVESVPLLQKLFNLGSRPNRKTGSQKDDIKEPATARFFKEWYAPILMHPAVRALSMIWMVIYLGGAYYGCTQIKEGLEPVNLLVQDSYAIPHYHLLEKYFWKYGATLQIVVNNAPDFRKDGVRERVKAMIAQFATSNHSIGMESAQCWIFEMERYYEQLDTKIVDSHFYGMLQHYLASAKNLIWTEDLYWDRDARGDDVVTSFRFLIGLRDIVTTIDQTEATLLFRDIASQWGEYNVTTFMPLWLFTDQYVIIVPNTVQNIIIALLVMIVIALMLIPQPLCAFWVALACASIDFGVIGYMTLWGVNLDAISMITIIMSIGFSVDYSAHITYGYVVSPCNSPADRVIDALSALGWPLFQGGLSTILAVVVLADVPAYMIVTFFKTVVLAISLGLLHGLVFLPVLLSIFVRGCCTISHANHAASSTPSIIYGTKFEGSTMEKYVQVSPSVTTGLGSSNVSSRIQPPSGLPSSAWSAGRPSVVSASPIGSPHNQTISSSGDEEGESIYKSPSALSFSTAKSSSSSIQSPHKLLNRTPSNPHKSPEHLD
ncbi:hypothetical protein WR25_13015 [Diploscapter pachys]|uniref:SSD domain-containing protein n=1 Tax=Diploscapter pachys TaxID=2018661 RepID=A0A2A2LX63_9BILA|nr:hypothetical protein WR25_13015 [Diploscapter pachys]